MKSVHVSTIAAENTFEAQPPIVDYLDEASEETPTACVLEPMVNRTLEPLIIEKLTPRDAFDGLTPTEEKFLPRHLFYVGDLELLQRPRVSVVGSRKLTSAGRKRAEVVTSALVERGIVVVSGLAEGVDAVAHKTAIQRGGRTIAVVGTPLDTVYPKSNTELFCTIAAEHLVVSQFDEHERFGPKAFPMRNRTMALLSDATIVIEASEKSGTRHQGWEALRLGRSLFILESIVEDRNISWARKMLDYGAQVLTREAMGNVLDDLPTVAMAGAADF